MENRGSERSRDWTKTRKKHKPTKELQPIKGLTPEQVAANESMKNTYIKPEKTKHANKKMSTLQHSTKVKTQTKKPIEQTVKSKYDIYLEIGTWRKVPVTDSWINNLAAQLVQWADDPKSLKFNQFLKMKKIDHTDFNRWMKRIPNLKKAYEYAIKALGDNREIGAIHKDYDKGMILPIMHRYDSDWKKAEEWRAEISKKDNEDDSEKVVIIERYKEEDKK